MEKRARPAGPRLAGMTIKLSHAFVWCLDQDEALRFYTDTLGLELRTDAAMENMRWLTVGPPGQPDVEVGAARAGARRVGGRLRGGAPARRQGRPRLAAVPRGRRARRVRAGEGLR